MLAFDPKDRISFKELFDHPLIMTPDILEGEDEQDINYIKTIHALVISEN